MTDFYPHLCIAASAGSGKTFQLAHRFLRLLAMEQPPDRIGAYTFSRKAAGEIFDEIMGYLLLATATDEGADTTSGRIGQSRDRAAFEADLRRVFHHLHRLRIGTLDSRIAQMLSAASVELGLPPEFAVLDRDSSEYQRLQLRILNGLFGGGRLDPEQADTFLQLFEEASHGRAEKDLFRSLEGFIGDYRVSFLTYPDPEVWKGPDLHVPPRVLEASERTGLADEVLRAIPSQIGHKSLLNSVAKVVEACREFEPGSSWSAHLPGNKAQAQIVDNGDPVLFYGKKGFPISPDTWNGLQALMDHVCAVLVDEARSRTQAVYGFLFAYEQAYRSQLFPGGTLAFEDACHLMSGFDLLSPSEIAYRLDGEIDHWLLDEFQDTNHLQWNVLLPFLEEVRMDPEQRRSFFYVGDVKQAIYGWRGGDSELFGAVQDAWPGLHVEALDVSFRSSQPVLDLVNTLMGDVDRLDELNPEAVDRWNREFSPHTAANADRPGCARVLQCEEKDTEMTEVIRQMVAELPEKRDIAILTRTNDEGRLYAETLRNAGFEVSLEGSSPARDDTGVELVLAALRLAAHPGDDYSRVFLRLAGMRPDPVSVLRQVNAEGLTPVVRHLRDAVPLEPGAAYSRNRLQRLVHLAVEFDTRGDRSIDRFLAFVDQARLKEHEAHGLIRIMTIHQSKGLGFDAVLLPVSDSAQLCRMRRGELGVHAEVDGASRIGLLPPKDVCMRIPEYREMYLQQESAVTYETFCLLYVALTRAKRSLHVVLPAPPSSGPGSLSKVGHWIADRVKETESAGETQISGAKVLVQYGDPDCWEDSATGPEVEAVSPPFLVETGPEPLSRLEPSQADASPQEAESIFRYTAQDGRTLGTRVHELMRQVEWTDDLDLDAFMASHGETPDSEVGRHLINLANLPELRKQDDVQTLWREQRFESVLPEGWVTGIFDRVVVGADAAWIQDFKTNRRTGPETVEHYRPQMEMYRTVLADLLSLDPDRVTCQLLFSGTGEVVEV